MHNTSSSTTLSRNCNTCGYLSLFTPRWAHSADELNLTTAAKPLPESAEDLVDNFDTLMISGKWRALLQRPSQNILAPKSPTVPAADQAVISKALTMTRQPWRTTPAPDKCGCTSVSLCASLWLTLSFTGQTPLKVGLLATEPPPPRQEGQPWRGC